jgi:hypothetical protein
MPKVRRDKDPNKSVQDLNALRQQAREKYLRELRQQEEIEEQLQNIGK